MRRKLFAVPDNEYLPLPIRRRTMRSLGAGGVVMLLLACEDRGATAPVAPVATPPSSAGIAASIANGAGWRVGSTVNALSLYEIWGESASDVWIAGQAGAMFHFDGRAWSGVPTGTTKDFGNTMWGRSASDIYATAYTRGGGGGQLFHYDGTRWSPVSLTIPGNIAIGPVWGRGKNDVWVGGDDGLILHFDGSTWAQASTPMNGAFYGIWGSSRRNVWGVLNPKNGTGNIAHYDGRQWTQFDSPTGATLTAVWGESARSVWAVGLGGVIVHFDGSAWGVVPSPTTADLTGIWGASARDIWAVGGGGTIVHYDGSAWSVTATGTTSPIYHVWGADKDHVWATSDAGSILAYGPLRGVR